VPSSSRATSWRDSFAKRFSLPDSRGRPGTGHSVVDILTILRHHPDTSDIETPISQLQLLTSGYQTTGDAELLRVRIQIQRQLRFLFIYPLVYIGMWIVPFASHVLQYNDKYAVNPPFELQCATTVFACSQAAIDCWLFSTREKPWRQIPSGNGGFWESLKFWTGWEGARRWRSGHGPGKTRAEMDREARSAYRRREEELSQRKNEVEREATKRGERSWWEVGVDGTMSPVIEEGDPFETPAASSGGGEGSTTFNQSGPIHLDPTTGRERELQHFTQMISTVLPPPIERAQGSSST
jgi:G protein-coupled receptor GPR1